MSLKLVAPCLRLRLLLVVVTLVGSTMVEGQQAPATTPFMYTPETLTADTTTTTPSSSIIEDPETRYLNAGSLKSGTCECKYDQDKFASGEMDYACCNIDEPSYSELDQLRRPLAESYQKLHSLYLFKSDLYTFLTDTDYNFTVDTVYNSNFVVGYFRRNPPKNGQEVTRYYLSYCELSPELLWLTVTQFVQLNTLHLDHVRLLPYPHPDGPADVLNLAHELSVIGSYAATVQVLSLVDCKIRSLNVKYFRNRTQSVTLGGFTQLRMLSLASNGLTSVDDNTGFFGDLKNLWYLDLSHNQLNSFNGNLLPSSITELHLEDNPMKQLDADHFKTFKFQELYCNDLMLTNASEMTDLDVHAALNYINHGNTSDTTSTNTTKTPAGAASVSPPVRKARSVNYIAAFDDEDEGNLYDDDERTEETEMGNDRN